MTSSNSSSALELIDIHASYGDAEVLHGIDITVNRGEIVAVVGANGAGKSTAVKCAMGLLPTTRGTIRIGDTDLTTAPAWSRARLGIGCVPERRQVFGELTVLENLIVGARPQHPAMSRTEIVTRVEEICGLFPPLRNLKRKPADLLSGGQQQMLAIGRALMPRPRFLILDEPSLGLAPALVTEIFEMIRRISADTGILMLEQNARAALGLADRGILFADGRVVASGTGSELANSPELMELYLGASSQTEDSMARDGHPAAVRLRAALHFGQPYRRDSAPSELLENAS
jgi:ABC-type branched-subunit amino acid transport system ATPase component